MRGQSDFAALCLTDQHLLSAGGQSIEINAALLTKALGDGQVKVAASQAVVPADGSDADHVLKPLHQGHIQSTTAQVEDQADLVILALVDMGGHSGSRGLIHQSLHFHPR